MSPAFVQEHFLELLADWLLESNNGEKRTCIDCGAETLRKRCAPCDHKRYLTSSRQARKLVEAA